MVGQYGSSAKAPSTPNRPSPLLASHMSDGRVKKAARRKRHAHHYQARSTYHGSSAQTLKPTKSTIAWSLPMSDATKTSNCQAPVQQQIPFKQLHRRIPLAQTKIEERVVTHCYMAHHWHHHWHHPGIILHSHPCCCAFISIHNALLCISQSC